MDEYLYHDTVDVIHHQISEIKQDEYKSELIWPVLHYFND